MPNYRCGLCPAGLAPPMLKSSMTVEIACKRLVAQDVVVFDLVDPAGGDLPAFSAGSHIDVVIRPGLMRQYSLCNPPPDTRRYTIAVLKEVASRGGSLAMHEMTKGELLQISEPRNHFELDGDAGRSLLFAGGIGITPILCMAERLHRVGADFELHYCARALVRMAFHQELASSAFAERVHLHLDDGPVGEKLDLDAVLKNEAEAGAHLYVCGPSGFIEGVLAAAAQHGFAQEALHREFFTVDSAKEAKDASAFQIQIASTGQILSVASDRSALEVMREHGVSVPASCELGVCGTCITRILAGVPDHHDFILNAKERAAGDQFTPCCSRAKSPLLVLDL